jgi:hypothetical protein
MANVSDTDDFRSVNELLGTLTTTELQQLEIYMLELEQSPAFRQLLRLIRVEREQAVRGMVGRVLEHAAYAHKGGYVKGLVGPENVIATVKRKASQVRAAGGFMDAETGTEGDR